MPGDRPSGDGAIHSHFEYYVLRLTRSEQAGLRGTAERLGSQRRVEFDGAEALLRLLGEPDHLDGQRRTPRAPE